MGTGNRVFVYYRATSGDSWSIYGFSSGTVSVTAAVFDSITVTAPVGLVDLAPKTPSPSPRVPLPTPRTPMITNYGCSTKRSRATKR